MTTNKQRVTGFAEVNGTKLYYEMMGKGHPLVLIHGGYMDTKMWEDQFAVFAEHYDATLVPSPQYASARQRVREHLSNYSFAYFLDPASKQELAPTAYKRLADIHVPTLLIVGADDHFHLHRIAETLEDKIVGARRVLIPETHHMPNMEKPEAFNQIVLGFLSRL